MCHHYVGLKNANRALLEEAFHVRANLALAVSEFMSPAGGFYPLKSVPIIRLEHGERALAACSWGFLPSWWKPKKEGEKPQAFQRQCFNAKSETVDTKPTFRTAYKSRRCLLPASKFEEKAHYFSLPDEQPFAFAGLWESWHDGELVSCTMLTTEPNEEVRGVGHHRMPVILRTEAEYARWLDPEITTRAPLEGLMEPLEDGALMAAPKV